MISKKVTVIDYGVGNLLSVKRALEHCGANVEITSDIVSILNADKLILPGVGAFPVAMNFLKELKLVKPIQDYSSSGKPLMAICLGMQLLLEESSEFESSLGLGIMPGKVIPIPSFSKTEHKLKIPHIGWSSINPSDKHSDWKTNALACTNAGDSFYFVHSFMAQTEIPAHTVATARYGWNDIPAVISKDNVIGVQFHPEKSGENGLTILKEFLER